jgi:hypothetical protein
MMAKMLIGRRVQNFFDSKRFYISCSTSRTQERTGNVAWSSTPEVWAQSGPSMVTILHHILYYAIREARRGKADIAGHSSVSVFIRRANPFSYSDQSSSVVLYIAPTWHLCFPQMRRG